MLQLSTTIFVMISENCCKMFHADVAVREFECCISLLGMFHESMMLQSIQWIIDFDDACMSNISLIDFLCCTFTMLQ